MSWDTCSAENDPLWMTSTRNGLRHEAVDVTYDATDKVCVIQQAVVRRLEKRVDLKWSFGDKEEEPWQLHCGPMKDDQGVACSVTYVKPR